MPMRTNENCFENCAKQQKINKKRPEAQCKFALR